MTGHDRTRAALATLAVLMLLLTGCDGPAGTDGVQVVTTTTVLGDVVRNVVGDDADVEVLIPLGADPHDYQASSRQVAALSEADLVVVNGLLLEEGLGDVLDAVRGDGANILELAPLLSPLPFGDEAADPHVWLDPIRMGEAARLISAELAALEPTVDWSVRADAYANELLAADQQIQAVLAGIPADRRKLVTNHDALDYFAARYDFEVVGTVIPGGSTLADPSSAELAALVELIRLHEVTAIFTETTEPSALADAVAAESGIDVEVVDLYTGSLGEPGSGADTLIGMLLTNANRIAAALGTELAS